MRSPLALSLIYAILFASTFALTTSHAQEPTTSSNKAATQASGSGIVLAEDTPIRLRLSQNLSSGTSKVNDTVDFDVIEDVKVGDTIVIQQGATAIATVTKASPKKSFGRSGKLDVNIDYVRLINGDKVSLRAVKGGSGGSRTGV